MRYLLVIAILFNAAVSLAQNEAFSKIPADGKTLQAFIPAGYDTLATTTGDLNKDKINDYVVVLKPLKEDSYDPAVDTGDYPERVLLVLLGKQQGYKLAVKTSKVIMCKECGGVFGDPFASIAIINGILIIDHYGGSAWRWSYTHKYRYQQNDFYLIGETTNSYWNVKMCDELNDFAGTTYRDVNLVTGAYKEVEISEECKMTKNKKGKQKVKPLKKLKDFILDF